MDTALARPPAATLATKVAHTPVDAVRLVAEAEILATAQMPGVVELVGLEGDADHPVLVTTRVDGPDLARLTDLAAAEIAGLLAAVATVLADLHGLGIVHGAVVADHVVVGPDGRPVLCGFGYGGRSGEPPVAEAPLPETAADPARAPGDPLSPASDVYALGALLQALLSVPPAGGPADARRGRPAAGRRRLRRPRARRNRRPAPAERSARDALRAVAARALAADPALRLSARSLAAAVGAAVPGARLPRRSPARSGASPLGLGGAFPDGGTGRPATGLSFARRIGPGLDDAGGLASLGIPETDDGAAPLSLDAPEGASEAVAYPAPSGAIDGLDPTGGSNGSDGTPVPDASPCPGAPDGPDSVPPPSPFVTTAGANRAARPAVTRDPGGQDGSGRLPAPGGSSGSTSTSRAATCSSSAEARNDRPVLVATAPAAPPPAAAPAAGTDVPALGALRARGRGPSPPAGGRPHRRLALAAAAAVLAVVAVAGVGRMLSPGGAAPPRRGLSSPGRPGVTVDNPGAGAQPAPSPATGAAAAASADGTAALSPGSAAPPATGDRSTTGAAGAATAAPGSRRPPPTTPHDPPCPAVTAVLAADTDGDGCPEALRWADGVISSGDRRWAVGQ
ncbi:MAG: hypothetical protein ABR511_02465, partial [Acidimicrobiales bacterium]